MTALYFIAAGIAIVLIVSLALMLAIASFGGSELTESQVVVVSVLLIGALVSGAIAWRALRRSDRWPD